MIQLDLTTLPAYVDHLREVHPHLEAILGNVGVFSENDEGYTGFVFEIQSKGQKYFFKQFRNYKKKVPHLKYYPEAAEAEARALVRFRDIHLRNLGKSYVPELVHYDPENFVIFMTDVTNDGRLLFMELNDGVFDTEVAGKIGYLMGVLHSRTYGSEECIRDGDTDHLVNEKAFDNKCRHVFTLHNGEIREIIESLSRSPQHSLIYGDLFPNNIIVSVDRFPYLYDFTVARNGDPAFELGYCSAHYVLMMLSDPQFQASARTALELLFNSYNAEMAIVLDTDRAQINERALQFIGTTIMYNFTRRTTDKYVRNIQNRSLTLGVAAQAIKKQFANISELVESLRKGLSS